MTTLKTNMYLPLTLIYYCKTNWKICLKLFTVTLSRLLHNTPLLLLLHPSLHQHVPSTLLQVPTQFGLHVMLQVNPYVFGGQSVKHYIIEGFFYFALIFL